MNLLKDSLLELVRRTSVEIPADVHRAILASLEQEKKGTIAESAMKIIDQNIALARNKSQPICQDTGIVVVFLKIGMDVRWEGATMSITDMVNEGVRRANHQHPGRGRAAVRHDPFGLHQGPDGHLIAAISGRADDPGRAGFMQELDSAGAELASRFRLGFGLLQRLDNSLRVRRSVDHRFFPALGWPFPASRDYTSTLNDVCYFFLNVTTSTSR